MTHATRSQAPCPRTDARAAATASARGTPPAALAATLAIAFALVGGAALAGCETTERPDRTQKTSLKSTGTLPKATFKKGAPLE